MSVSCEWNVSVARRGEEGLTLVVLTQEQTTKRILHRIYIMNPNEKVRNVVLLDEITCKH
jgi:hypothetical protein